MMRDEEEEEEANEKALLEQVFGQSSSSSSDEDDDGRSDSDSDCGERGWEWESMKEVKGLWICRDFLSPHQQSRLLSAIEAENWFAQPSINQAMRFGHQHLPQWAIQLSRSIRRCSLQHSSLPFPPNLLHREPLFDQMITNVYQPGEGICAHVDLLRFDDGIAIISLESSCVMHFTPLPEPGSESVSVSVPVLLTPGSLVLMSGDARYRWKHEINRRPGFQLWQGQQLTQTRRTSITLRKLCFIPS